MSDTPVTPVAGTPAPVAAPAAPAKPLTAIQLIEQEMVGFFKQREQAISNVHAIDGAIQAAQHLLAKLKAEEAKAVALAKTVVKDVEEGVETAVKDVESKVVSIESAVKKLS